MSAGGDHDELARRLAEVDLLRRRVLNVIPHALRTPITTLRGLVEALSTASEQEIREQITPALQRLAGQAENLLDDMLIAAGLTTAMPTGAPVPTPLVATARQVWSELAAGSELQVAADPGIHVLLPPGSLFKVLVHVLDNHHKYGEPPVSLEATVADGACRVTVASGGPEVDAAELEMAFEPFYRSEKAVMRAAGLGVGLTVARALVEQVGGRLLLSAGDGGGVVTHLELPAR